MPTPAQRESRVPVVCGALYVLALALSAINPEKRDTWIFENIVPVIIIVMATATYRTFRFSDRAYLQGLVFLLLHTLATWYTYPLVPVGDWLRLVLDTERNHYDRVVHFAYGLLLFVPVRELAFRREPRKNLVTELYLTMCIIMWLAVGYEFLEWWAHIIVHSDSSVAFLGSQGDTWDAQQDLFVALVGSTIAAVYDGLVVALRRHRRAPAPAVAVAPPRRVSGVPRAAE